MGIGGWIWEEKVVLGVWIDLIMVVYTLGYIGCCISLTAFGVTRTVHKWHYILQFKTITIEEKFTLQNLV